MPRVTRCRRQARCTDHDPERRLHFRPPAFGPVCFHYLFFSPSIHSRVPSPAVSSPAGCRHKAIVFMSAIDRSTSNLQQQPDATEVSEENGTTPGERWASTVAALRSAAELYQPEWIAMRRLLHQHPETSGAEYQTTQQLGHFLERHKLPFRLAEDGRGLITDIGDWATADRRIAIRGDIDALPIQTKLQTEYASQMPGAMHACGHDVHATTAVGAAVLLNRLHEQGRLPAGFAARIILQPAEETSQGAKHMIRSGALDGVDAAIALHVDPTLETGRIGVRRGALTANCDLFQVDFHGTGGHGARPHLSTDPLSAGVAWINQAYRQLPRQADPFDPMAISVGRFSAGTTANVIPSQATLEGTLRTVGEANQRTAKRQLEHLSRGVEAMTDVIVVLKFFEPTPGVMNSGPLCDTIQAAAEMLDSVWETVAIERPSLGGEDFAFFGQQVPIAMFRLGSRRPGAADDEPTAHALHTPSFDIDPNCLQVGAEMLALSAMLLRPEHVK